jgi:hypothetical protein
MRENLKKRNIKQKTQHDVPIKHSEIKYFTKIIYHGWLWDGLPDSKKLFSLPPNPDSLEAYWPTTGQ